MSHVQHRIKTCKAQLREEDYDDHHQQEMNSCPDDGFALIEE